MDIENSKLALGGQFYFEHYRDGKLLSRDNIHNLFVDEGLKYALNCAFGASVGGAPSPISTFYIGLSTANRTWLSTDDAATVNATAVEFELYSGNRPAWAPVALADDDDPANLKLDDAGSEASFTVADLTGVGGSVLVRGAFAISSATKDGSGDTNAVLLSGSDFPSPRELFTGDVFKVGYVLRAASGS